MGPFAINGTVWGVVGVNAGDPRLVDRTGSPRLAVTDPSSTTVYVRADLVPPLLDRVMLHEVAHAVTVSWGLLPPLYSDALRGDMTGVEEWSAQLVEKHAMEAVQAASAALGRPICIGGLCSD